MVKKLSNKRKKLINKGANIKDLEKLDIRGSLVLGKNSSVDINIIFEGDVKIGSDVIIQSNCIIKNSIINSGTIIKSYTIIDNAKISEKCIIGPYANIRPGTRIGQGSSIGNYVEIKNSKIGKSVKINHHSFIGDSNIGNEVIIGAGTITCNHDGFKINKTFIGKAAYIGSGSKLIAPIKLGSNCIIGAGSVIVENVPSNKLSLSRPEQLIKDINTKSSS